MQSQDFVCKALELAEETRKAFEQAVGNCEDALGKEVFTLLSEDGKTQTEYIGQVSQDLARGKDWAAACSLPEAQDGERREHLRIALAGRTDKLLRPGSCLSQLGAVLAARTLVESNLTFYDGWLAGAVDEVERRFIERMRAWFRGQLVVLADLEAYYTDPQAWALAQDRAELDGA